VEGTLSVQGATVELARHLDRLSPFGNGNEEPAFVLPRTQVVRAERIGREGATIRAWLQGEGGGPRLKALLFRAKEGPLAQALLSRGGPLHLAGYLRAEEWQGSVNASFFIADAAAA
jgi:single-stranded-DNA-specific exonuclease